MNRETAIREAIDRYGPDFNVWPDRGLAGEARQAILADRALRAWYDDAAILVRGLQAARAAADAEIAASGAIARIESGLARRLPRRSASRRWIAVAAALVVAAGLGSAYDLAIGGIASGGQPLNVVVLDPLVFGPAEVEAQ
jgi:hypothetical protein